jgi:hypothetical protein
MSDYEDPLDFDPFPDLDYWDDDHEERVDPTCACRCGCTSIVSGHLGDDERCSMCSEACLGSQFK